MALAPWLPWALLGLCLVGGASVRAIGASRARMVSVVIASACLMLAGLSTAAARLAPSGALSDPFGLLGIDALAGLLVPLTALLGWALILAAPRSFASPEALSRLLVNLALVTASFLVRDAHAFAALWLATLVPPYLELRRLPGARNVARVYAIYSAASAVLIVIGLLAIGLPLTGRADVWDVRAWSASAHAAGLIALLMAVFIRKATLPFHSWLAMVFSVAAPGPVLLLVAPMVGAYALVRFTIPISAELLGPRVLLLGPIALLTAAYAAGLAFVQADLKRIVAWLTISQSAVVLVGLECSEGAGLTGGIVSWLSAAAGMTGLGLSAWMLEARFGSLDIKKHRGLYRRSRALALVFLLSGLSLVGFPGTVGFASLDLLSSAVLASFPITGILLFFATALSGFTVLRTYLRLFHGPPARGPELALLPREWLALLIPFALVIVQGLYPAPLVALGEEASRALLTRSRDTSLRHDIP